MAADGAKIDVPRLARAAGLTRGVAAPSFEPTKAQETALTRLVQSIVAEWRKELRDTILPSYRENLKRRDVSPLRLGIATSELDDLERTLNAAASRTAALAARTEPAVAAFAAEFAAWHTARFVDGIKAATRVDIGVALSPSDAEDLLRAAVKRNVALIRGLDAEMAKKIELAVYDAWNKNDSAKKLIKTLNAELGFAPSRAKLIGRDQIGKLAGELDRLRHADANITKFVWVRTVSAQPRPEHLENAGKVFAWSSPPGGVIPGQLINCKCRAMAYVEPSGASAPTAAPSTAPVAPQAETSPPQTPKPKPVPAQPAALRTKAPLSVPPKPKPEFESTKLKNTDAPEPHTVIAYSRRPTGAERLALEGYKGDDFATINEVLRGQRASYDFAEDRINSLDSILGNATLNKNATLYRGVSDQTLASLGADAVGTRFNVKTYQSTSLSRGVATRFAVDGKGKDYPVLMKINAKKGASAIDMDNYGKGYTSQEREVLLPRNASYTVRNISEQVGLNQNGSLITLKVVEVDLD